MPLIHTPLLHRFLRLPAMLLSLVCLIAANVSAQKIGYLQYSLEEGLPQSQVYAICEDRQGYLWLATQGGGLVRYDGNSFQVFTYADGLPSNNVQSLCVDREGTLWIGTEAGLGYFRGKFERLEGSAGFSILSIADPGHGPLLLGTDKGLYSVGLSRPYSWKATAFRHKALIYQICPGPGGIYLATNLGLFGEKGGVYKALNTQYRLPPGDITALSADRSGRLWVAHFEAGLFACDLRRGQRIDSLSAPDMRRLQHLQETPDGQLWAGGQNSGLFRFVAGGGKWENLNEAAGFINNHVRCIFGDSWGNTWVGTSGSGLLKLANQEFEQFGRRKGLPDERIYAVRPDAQGRVWFAMGNSGVAYLEQDVLVPVLDLSKEQAKAKTLWHDAAQRVWVGTEGKGIYVLDRIKIDSSGRDSLLIDTLDVSRGLPSDWVRSLAQDSMGRYWAALSGAGLVSFQYDSSGISQVRRHAEEAGLRGLEIEALQQGPDHTLWFNGRNGLVGKIHPDGQISLYQKDNGLPNTNIRSLAFQGNLLFAGSSGMGIFVADLSRQQLRFTALSGKASLYSSNIYSLLFERDNILWAGTESGADRISLDAGFRIEKVEHFGRNQGFSGIETCRNAAAIDAGGRLWFGTLQGLMRYTNVQAEARHSRPRIHLSEVQILYSPLDYEVLQGKDTMLVFPFKDNHLSFKYEGVDLNFQASLSYRWRLVGLRDSWSPWTHEQSVSFAGLPAGKYRFEVQARNILGQSSERAILAWEIKKPFWQELWFWILCALSFTAGLFYLVVWWYRRRLQRAQLRNRELATQNQLFALRQQALQLQMNPHFIFNVLNSIQSLIAEGRIGDSRSAVTRFARLMRSILYNSRKERISLAEELQTLQLYLETEQFCRPRPFDFEISLQHIPSPEDILIPTMLVQPFIENAIVHGIASISRRGNIRLQFEVRDGALWCSIRDNGIGYYQSLAQKKEMHQSLALQVTRERLQNLWPSGADPLQITELEKNGEIRGTEICFSMPLEMTY